MNSEVLKMMSGIGGVGTLAAGGTVYGFSGGVNYRFLDRTGEKRTEKFLERLRLPCPEGFIEKRGRCRIPNELREILSIGSREIFSKTREKDCLDENLYWRRGAYGDASSGRCHTMNLTLRPEFEREIEDWDSEGGEFRSSDGDPMSHFAKGQFWEIKKLGNIYGLLIKKEKMTDGLRNWDFPNHFKKNDHFSVSVWDMCHKLKEAVGDSGSKELYLYNQRKDT